MIMLRNCEINRREFNKKLFDLTYGDKSNHQLWHKLYIAFSKLPRSSSMATCCYSKRFWRRKLQFENLSNINIWAIIRTTCWGIVDASQRRCSLSRIRSLDWMHGHYIWKELLLVHLDWNPLTKTYWLKTSWTTIGWKDFKLYKLENHLLDVRNLIFNLEG